MDKGKLVRLVLIPIIIGLVVTLIVRQVMPGGPVASAVDPVELIAVVAIAGKEPVRARTKLTEAHLTVKQVPRAFVTGSEYTAVKDLVGFISLMQLEPGEVILRSRVVEEGKGSLPYRIPKGARAITIRMDELNGVAGHPDTGDLIDVLLVLPAKTPERPQASSRILLEGVLVLGKGVVDNGPEVPGAPEGAPKLSSITLALQPEQATELALAEQMGHLKMMLRPALKELDAGKIILTESRFQVTPAR